jgi:hypothetical protein
MCHTGTVKLVSSECVTVKQVSFFCMCVTVELVTSVCVTVELVLSHITGNYKENPLYIPL